MDEEIKMSFALENGELVCSLEGRLDTGVSSQISEALQKELEAKPASVVLDLGEVYYICSAFLRICLQLAKDFGKDAFSVRNALLPVKKIFKISALDTMMKIE